MKDQSIFPVLIILMLRALAGSKTICDFPYGAWALPTGLFADGHGARCAQFFLSMWGMGIFSLNLFRAIFSWWQVDYSVDLEG